MPPAAAKLPVCHPYGLHPPHITLVYGMAEFRARITDAAYSISALPVIAPTVSQSVMVDFTVNQERLTVISYLYFLPPANS